MVEASTHLIGINMGYGMQSADLAEESSISNDNLSGGVYYRYMPSHFWGVETTFSQGTSGFSSMIRSGLNSNVQSLSYNSIDMTLVGELPLGVSNSIYVKGGAAINSVDYELKNGGRNNIQELGMVGGVGWRYQFDMGLSMGIEYKINQAKRLGVDLFNFGLSYRF